MFGNLFKPRPKEGKVGEKSPATQEKRTVRRGAQETPEEEYQLPYLRRKEEEKLRERYQLASAKTGDYL